LADLATIVKNRVTAGEAKESFVLTTAPTPFQGRAFELLGVTLSRQ
jgi:hypothetical protein